MPYVLGPTEKSLNILVTGASGFVGAELCARLIREGHSVIGISRHREGIADGIRWIQFDLVNDEWHQLDLPPVHVVYHLAAQTNLDHATHDPIMDLAANVVSVIKMLEYFRQSVYQPFVVNTGTVTQVGITDSTTITESMKDDPVSFYDLSKLTAENYLKQYVREGFIRGCTLRLANVYGQRNPPQGGSRSVLDRVFRRALDGDDVYIYGSANCLRDYLYIDDVVEALKVAFEYPSRLNGNTYLLGTGTGTTVADAFQIAVDLASNLRKSATRILHVETPENLNPIELRNAIVDSTPFRTITGWFPKWTIKSGLLHSYTIN